MSIASNQFGLSAPQVKLVPPPSTSFDESVAQRTTSRWKYNKNRKSKKLKQGEGSKIQVNVNNVGGTTIINQPR